MPTTPAITTTRTQQTTPTPTAGDTTNTKKGTGFNSLSSEDFIKILTNELSRQDPLAPNDSKAILEQISSIRSIESNLSLKSSLESLVSQNQFATAGGLIGKYVQGLDGEAKQVSGIVKSVANTKNGASLLLDTGSAVLMKQLQTAADAPPRTPGRTGSAA